MKRIVSLLTSMLLVAICSFAQSGEGTLVLEITDMSSDNPQMAAMADMFKGNETLVYFKEGESLTKINMMGGMIKMDLKQDKDKNLDLLMDAMGQKIWVNSPKLEQERMQAEMDNPMSEMDITYDMDDKKTIAGFECFKMNVAFPDAPEGTSLSAYVTDQIEVRPSIIQGVDLEDFKGLPLEYVFSNPMMEMTITTTSFEPTVDASVFDLNTSGFQKMTMDEFIEMTQQFGGGGFGF